MKQLSIPPSAAGRLLSDYLLEVGYAVAMPCGGVGKCGKCRVKVTAGCFYARNDPQTPLMPDADGCVAACRALCSQQGATVLLTEETGDGLTASRFLPATSEPSAPSARYGVALDIGTTTLAAALVDTASGRVYKQASALNSQKAFGADVINRIAAASRGQLIPMQNALLQSVRALLYSLDEGQNRPIETLMVTGNPTMLHLFAGVSPESMGAYPFTPVFVKEKLLSGNSLSLPVERVVLLPSASAFIGADVLVGGALLNMEQSDVPCLLMDIGTNGEILLATGAKNRKRLLAASAAAGPALEGATISCGMGGVAGAVSSVKNSRAPHAPFVFRTVEDAPPAGLCGSGLLDLCACLLDKGLLDESGHLTQGSFTLSGIHEREGARTLSLTDTPVVLQQADIRELQLAKSALRAGVEALLAEASLTPDEIDKVYLAGGLGYYLDPSAACRVGIFPASWRSRIQAVGNTSLAGAVRALSDADFRAKTAALSEAVETVELNLSPVFNEAFMENMLF